MAARSLTVTLTAWSLIIAGLLGLFAAGLLGLLAGAESLSGDAGMASSPMMLWLPSAAQWMVGHLGLLAMVTAVLSVAAIPLGIALYRRRPWARVASVWSCVVLAVLHFAAVPWQWWQLAQWRESIRATLPQLLADGIEAFYWPMQLTGAVTTLVFAAAFAGVAWRLSRPAVAVEFVESA